MPEHFANANDILRTLHRIHIQLGDLNDRLIRGPRKVKAAENRVAELQAISDAATKAMVGLRVATEGRQADLDRNIANIKKRRDQLMEAKDNREFTSLKSQIAADEAANGVFEDEILEALDRIDDLKQKAGVAKEDLARSVEHCRKITQEVTGERETILSEIARLEGELKDTEKCLNAEFSEQYRRIFRSKAYDTLAMLEETHCKGCNTTVPLNRISEIMKEKPVCCSACGRLLYLPENYRLS